ncbi:MAG: hypothetical protein AB7F35_26280 [Acetobacteraceae bacterium]
MLRQHKMGRDTTMRISDLLLTLSACLLAASCQSQTQVLDSESAVAMQTALQRGRFELGCPAAEGTVLSRNLLQPVAWRGLERAEYTIGVAGCGKRAVYISVCQLGSVACFAARSRDVEAVP